MKRKDENGRGPRPKFLLPVIIPVVSGLVLAFVKLDSSNALLWISFKVINMIAFLGLLSGVIYASVRIIKIYLSKEQTGREKAIRSTCQDLGFICLICLVTVILINLTWGAKKLSELGVGQVKEQVRAKVAYFLGYEETGEPKEGVAEVNEAEKEPQEEKEDISESEETIQGADQQERYVKGDATFYITPLTDKEKNELEASAENIKNKIFFLEKGGDSLARAEESYKSVVLKYEELRKHKLKDGINGEYPGEEKKIINLQAKQDKFFRDCDSAELYRKETYDLEDWRNELPDGNSLLTVIEKRKLIKKESRNGEFYRQDSNAYQKIGEEYIRQSGDPSVVLFYIGTAIEEKMQALEYSDINDKEYFIILEQIERCFHELADFEKVDKVTRNNAIVMYTVINHYREDNNQIK